MEKRSIEQDITDTDKRLDALIYNNYGLSQGKIKVVEGLQ